MLLVVCLSVFFYVKRDGKFCVPLKPLPGVFHERLNYFKDLLCRGVSETAPLEIQEFPNLYTGRRFTVYKKAADSLVVESISRRDSFIRAFGKCEKVNLDVKKDPVMRIVSPRNPR